MEQSIKCLEPLRGHPSAKEPLATFFIQFQETLPKADLENTECGGHGGCGGFINTPTPDTCQVVQVLVQGVVDSVSL